MTIRAHASKAAKTSDVRSRSPDAKSNASRTCSCGRPLGVTGECEQCKRTRIQRASAYTGAPVVSHDEQQVALAAGVGGGRGSTLDPSVRRTMERSFGVNFAQVRVHDDSASHASARSIGARAFTTGQDVHFAARQYRPSSPEGLRLLAHELAHTIQQRGAPAAGVAQRYQIGAEGSILEHEAQSAADAVTGGGKAHVTAGTATASALLQRQSTASPSVSGGGTNKAMSDGVPSAKWDPSVEALYRKTGDHVRASAVARCRTHGKPACSWLLTLNEVDALQALAEASRGDKKKFEIGLAGAAPLLAFRGAAASFAATPLTTVPELFALGAAAANDNALATGVARLSSVGASEAASIPSVAGQGARAIAATPGVSVGAVAVAGAALTAAYTALAVYELYRMSKFQAALVAAGFFVLEDPLAQAICHACHASTPSPTRRSWREPLDDVPDLVGRGPASRHQTPTAPLPGTKTAPAPSPAPIPQPKEEEKKKQKCPFPTGLSKSDPIPMVWLKPVVDDYYPRQITLDHGTYDRDDPHPHRLPIAGFVGVKRRYWPRLGKVVQLTKEPRGEQAARFRAVLERYGFDWKSGGGLQPDHVQDLEWDGPDNWQNLWPMSSDANASSGTRQNLTQEVTYCESVRGPSYVAQPLSVFKQLPGRYGRYFVIAKVER